MLIAQKKKSINIFNAVAFNSKSHSSGGGTIKCENNIFTLSGSTSKGANFGLLYEVDNLKPNTPYTFRITRLSGSNVGADLRFYIFTSNPKLAFVQIVCSIYTREGEETAVGRYTFTEDQIAKGIHCGVYTTAVNGDATYDNCQVRADIVEGSFTKDTMPPFEPYED
jgi:hypothetical protein